MYNEPGFYDMQDGAIGTILYNKNMLLGMPEEEKQAYVSRASNARMRQFLNNMTYGMNGNGPTDPAAAYMKAREDSWGDLEDGMMGLEQRGIQIQIGQKESYDAILNMEKKEDFAGWVNPIFVNIIKEQFNTK